MPTSRAALRDARLFVHVATRLAFGHAFEAGTLRNSFVCFDHSLVVQPCPRPRSLGGREDPGRARRKGSSVKLGNADELTRKAGISILLRDSLGEGGAAMPEPPQVARQGRLRNVSQRSCGLRAPDGTT